MNRLCPTFRRVGVTYQPASLTFSRGGGGGGGGGSHPLIGNGSNSGDDVGVADFISAHVSRR